MKKNKITLVNIVSNIFLQIVTIFSGFIIPKIILLNFGSDVNGLVSSLTQILSYISLLEGGVTSVISASLYKPLINKDNRKISSIIKTTNYFFRKIGLLFIIYSIIVAFVYPLIFNVEFSYIYVFTLTIILSISLLVQYMFSLTLKTLLIADKKIYVVSISQTIVIILNIVLAYISTIIYPSIHILKIITGILYICQPIIYSIYCKKNYRIDKNVEVDNNLIKNRWDGFANNIAAFIHFSTDITLLTIFTDLNTVSIYSVYSLVTGGLRQLINSVISAINPTIGQIYASGNVNELNKKISLFEYIINLIVFLVFTVSSLLITPFVMIYTSGINDTNYFNPLFGILLVISEAIYLIKMPHLSLAHAANKFKEMTTACFVEATLNVVISLILVIKFGLIGVVLGTLCGMIFRTCYQVCFTNKIIDRKPFIFFKKILIFSVPTLIGLIICLNFISTVEYTIFSWIFHAIIYLIIFVILYLIMSLLYFKDELKFIFNYLIRK